MSCHVSSFIPLVYYQPSAFSTSCPFSGNISFPKTSKVLLTLCQVESLVTAMKYIAAATLYLSCVVGKKKRRNGLLCCSFSFYAFLLSLSPRWSCIGLLKLHNRFTAWQIHLTLHYTAGALACCLQA